MSQLSACFDVSVPCGSAKVKTTPRNVLRSQFRPQKNTRMRKLAWLAGLALLTCFQVVKAQEPVTFKALLDQANSHYPALKSARLEKRAAIEEVEASRRLYWPNVSAVVEGASNQTSATDQGSVSPAPTTWGGGGARGPINDNNNQKHNTINSINFYVMTS